MIFDPIQLSALQPYHPTSQELETQKALAREHLHSILAQPVGVNRQELLAIQKLLDVTRDKVRSLGSQLIEMISDGVGAEIHYFDPFDLTNERVRQIFPLALYKKNTRPGQTIWKGGKPVSRTPRELLAHMKLDAFQVKGPSISMEHHEFKTFDLSYVNSLSETTSIDQETMQEIVNRFVLNYRNDAMDIIQYGELRLADVRKWLHIPNER